MAEERRAVRWLLSGRVQGVGFRYFTRQVAERLGVAGWVRNLPNGRVEIRAAADRAALESFKSRVAQGPPGGRVDAVEEEVLAEDPGWSGFSVRF